MRGTSYARRKSHYSTQESTDLSNAVEHQAAKINHQSAEIKDQIQFLMDGINRLRAQFQELLNEQNALYFHKSRKCCTKIVPFNNKTGMLPML